jgi:transposase
MKAVTQKSFFAITKAICAQCVRLQEEIRRLREENKRLKALLRYQQRQIDEGYFGSSTPSSKKLFKANTPALPNQGGARKGHPGHGRTATPEAEADEVISLDTDHECPACHVALESWGHRWRTVIEVVPVQVKRIVYRLARRRCPSCKHLFSAKAPGVLPKFKLGNSLLAHVATEHYLHQVTLGHLAKRLGLSEGSLIEAMHHLAQRFKEVPEKLIAQYRCAPVKHADETTWRNDGKNGYAWLFATAKLSIFRLRQSRAARVAHEVLGDKKLPGVLVVDRYNAYNQAPCALQYCYAHLLRGVKDLGKEFPENPEVQDFVNTTAPLMAKAMRLRMLPMSEQKFLARADRLKMDIVHAMHQPARHAGIQKIQNIFREQGHRLYHWAEDRAIPADNNFAERELRKLVIARKISLGSQGENGARTREILMTVLLTLNKRKSGDLMPSFKASLDEVASGRHQDPYQVLFSPNSS